jgi:hypothetical protein
VEVDGSRLHFQPAKTGGGVMHDDLELSFFAVDDKGKSHEGTFYAVNLTLKPDNYERVRAQGLRLNPRLQLPPGRYQLRVGVRESGAGEMGSVFYDLDVPDFSAQPLEMSGVLLTAGSARVIPTFQPDPAASALPGPATSRREFMRSDTINVFAEVYDNVPAQQPHRVEVATSLLSENGREVFKSSQTLSSDPKSRTKAAVFPYSTALPLTDAAPGRYLLRIEAALRGAGNMNGIQNSVHEALITVR